MITPLTLYHGSDCLFDAIDLSRSKNRRDFGKGFYTTTIAAQAESWARSKRLRGGAGAYVYVYAFTPSDSLRMRRFDGLSYEWLEMVKDNRTKGGLQHNFDVVIGPVADDDTMLTVSRYIHGVYTASEALKRLEYAKANDQLSFHTTEALACLHFQRRYALDF